MKTLEAEVETALHKMGGISDSNVGNLFKVKWSRSSRTDKGVHSLGTVGSVPSQRDRVFDSSLTGTWPCQSLQGCHVVAMLLLLFGL